MSIEQLYQLYLTHPSVQTDTRKIKPGDIFFALRGPSFNGNSFAAAALEAGAAYAVIDDPAFASGDKTLLVKDVLSTLQALAKHHRQQFTIPFIAITGSNGKTTTKELVHAVLSSSFITYTTQGNFNNHIGIPLTILSVKKDAEMAVIEMGANHQREIAGYCEYTLPTHGIITNAGKAHLEGFGGVEGVKKGKGELYDYLRQHGGVAFVMWDYDYLRDMSKGISQIISYGTRDASITGDVMRNGQFLQVQFTKGLNEAVHTQLVGDYNLPNILCAAAIGVFFKVPAAKIKNAIESYTPSNSRSQLLQKDGNTIILDAYNANPSSMKLAIENIAQLPAAKKVLLLGAMAELGEDSIMEHEQIIALIGRHQWAGVALTGGDFLKIAHPYTRCNNALEARDWFQQQAFTNATVLVKGSRSMQMEKVLEAGAK
ncbi:MAG TPA: UDP-N-acetylmuramoyl-tripeptide--D-alanyl-D-alanine ligase [Chitinophagaceae bacterium]|nr:UDP-N-acetylmuramoyl-tripeptide--D-alanyl-D-alanine ligase [Chitinophagaceae bacterium]